MGRPSKFDSAFKAKVALEALQEKETLLSLSKKYGVAPSVISKWKEELLQNSQKAFEPDTSSARRIKQLESKTARLERKVGQLTVGFDFTTSSAPIKVLMGLSLPPSTKALHSTYPFPKQSTKCLTCQKMGTRIVYDSAWS